MNVDVFLKDEELDELERLSREGGRLPWKWSDAGLGPQIEANIEYADGNPVLVAHGCGNGKDGRGCMPNLGDDPMRHCPLQPTAQDRNLIIAAVNALPALLAELRMYRNATDG